METLAWQGGGPGPWVLLIPVVWGAMVAVVVTVLRRAGRRGRGGAWQGRATVAEHSPIVVLGRRFAAGEIEEDEYWRRLSVLEEQFGRYAGGVRGAKGAVV
jgi:putative membrane protein